MQVKDRADKVAFVPSKLEKHVVGDARSSIVTVEFVLTVVVPMLTITVVVGKMVGLPVLGLY